jgi:hypothetical protein
VKAAADVTGHIDAARLDAEFPEEEALVFGWRSIRYEPLWQKAKMSTWTASAILLSNLEDRDPNSSRIKVYFGGYC